jgi:hypothetical protein
MIRDLSNSARLAKILKTSLPVLFVVSIPSVSDLKPIGQTCSKGKYVA